MLVATEQRQYDTDMLYLVCFSSCLLKEVLYVCVSG